LTALKKAKDIQAMFAAAAVIRGEEKKCPKAHIPIYQTYTTNYQTNERKLTDLR
tara:strand:+ start:575 stop:736 length:162 start_codon:yes stop_codon:yes gene_type:complete